jgi:hypothetical protein
MRVMFEIDRAGLEMALLGALRHYDRDVVEATVPIIISDILSKYPRLDRGSVGPGR